MKKKYISLQVLRGFAAWMVVYHHYIQSFHLTDSLSFLGRFIWKYGDFGVDIFFVLSGFVMYWSARSPKYTSLSFFLNRIYRIFPVYWFYTALMILSLALLPDGMYLTGFNRHNVLQSFFLYPAANPSGFGNFPILYVGWTLMYEMTFYTILSASKLVSQKYSIYICSAIILITPFILGKYGFFGHLNFLFFEFMVGLIIAEMYRHFHAFFTKYNWFFILFSVFGIILLNNLFGWVFKSKIFVGLFVILFFLGLEKAFESRNKINAFLEKLGDISYSTYLCHPVILGWYYFVIRDQGSIAVRLLTVALIGLTVYLFSIITYKHIEIAGWINDLKRWTDSVISAFLSKLAHLRR
jgi:exopolysaccharide production protein ExoZ